MKDPEQDLKNAYLAALKGAISINQAIVPVFVTVVPSNVPRPYICLSEVTVTDGGTGKKCPSFECTVLVDVVTEYDNWAYKPSEAAAIGAAVMQLSEDIGEKITNAWQVFSHRLDTSFQLLEDAGSKEVNRRLLRFRDKLFSTDLTEVEQPEESGYLLLENGGRIDIRM